MQRITKDIRLMGTLIHLMVIHPQADLLVKHLEKMLYRYNYRFSANDDRSELSQINLNAGIKPIRVHPELYELIALGKYHSIQAQSSLNIAIGPLIKLWHIGFKDARKPDHKEIDQVLKLIDPTQILLKEEEHSVYLPIKGMEIDLGALAKGYIADRLANYMKEQGVASGLINLGGNVLTVGPALNRPDYYWRIGIQDPATVRGKTNLTIKTFNQSVVTSGIYERVLKIGEETYHHIFDSETGYPLMTDIASVTIIAQHSVDCEIWTTRLFGLNASEIIRQIESIPSIEGVVITKKGQLLISHGVNIAD